MRPAVFASAPGAGLAPAMRAVVGQGLRAHLAALSPLGLLAWVTGAYLAAAMLFLLLIGGDLVGLIIGGLSSARIFLAVVQQMMPLWLLPLVALGLGAVVLGIPSLRRRARVRWREALLALLLSAAFVNGFSLVKTHLPAIVPFWADPMFTKIDVALGLTGSFEWLSGVSTLFLLKIYMNGWVFMATFLPAILAAFDDNAMRRRRFILLWAAAWVVLGNFLAAAFMSVGPIFLDLLPGGEPEAFPTLFALLQRPDAVELVAIREFLWANYANGQFSVGSGISAFPSVHVGMAMVFGLYLYERLTEAARLPPLPLFRGGLRALGLALPCAMVTVYLVLSVHLGWHYMSDGVASIAVIWALHALLARSLGPAAAQAERAYSAA